jgi:hypothetical protein
MRGKAIVAGIVISVVVLTSCAKQPAAPTPGSSVPGPDEPQINWNAPMASGVLTRNPSSSAISAAQSKFPLPLRIPQGLGSPVAIQVWDAATGAPAGQAGFALVYRVGGNPLDVIETTPSEPASEFYADMHSMVNQWESMPDLLHGSFKWVNLADGTEALVTISEDGNDWAIMFLDPDNVEVTIQGPGLTLDGIAKLASDVLKS